MPFFWGGWYYATPAWRDQLAQNGIGELTPEMLLTERVVLVTAPGGEPDKLLAYLAAGFGAVKAEIVEKTELFDAYAFRPAGAGTES